MSSKQLTKQTPSSSTPPLLWWESLQEECPITLEPISTLPYPPFELRQVDKYNIQADARVYYFDGLALATYIVSRGIFQNPLTREPLTMEDCRRLDEYLQSYCSSAIGNQQRNICVAEAFCLRESVQVTSSGSSRQAFARTAQDEDAIWRQRRAETLRSEAAAALCGLFVFGNQQRQSSWSEQHVDEGEELNGLQVPRLGFDLNLFPVEDTAVNNEMEGLTIIDDDEAVVVGADQHAYREMQESFPPLPTDNGGTLPRNSNVEPDSRLLTTVKETAQQEQLQQQLREHFLEQGKRQLVLEALKRREEQQRVRAQQQDIQKKNEQEKRLKNQDIQCAKDEIEKWREEQWERLRQMSEAQKQKTAQLQKTRAKPRAATPPPDEISKEEKEEQEKKELQEREERKAAKAAAKRKRARERKKAQKAKELEKVKKEEKEEARRKQKEASALKCAACGEGILGCGFDKFGHKFCSTKCARAGPTTTTTAT